MPVLSMFFGIIVTMHWEQGAAHHLPHVHARYAEFSVSVDLEGNVLYGWFPPKKLALLQVWIVLHEEDLAANWQLAMNGQQVFRIDPLK